jgi:hypothetical protein
MTISIVLAVLVVGWLAASIIGTQAYFLGEQTKPIHERNWSSDSFDALSKSITGREMNDVERIPAYAYDAYGSQQLNG